MTRTLEEVLTECWKARPGDSVPEPESRCSFRECGKNRVGNINRSTWLTSKYHKHRHHFLCYRVYQAHGQKVVGIADNRPAIIFSDRLQIINLIDVNLARGFSVAL
ncbi:hypothetical protein DPV78_006076 [Talaromyces pinophilus]|nr:hypothetical protein DPV78_006076 [Talaromyces pinophilus]